MNLFVSFKYLVALDDHKHFGRAAASCHITQPALSNALRGLEEHFGAVIVKRGRHFAGFTAEGERILQAARRVLREHELLQQDLHSRTEAPSGHLVIGAVPTAMPVAARFAARLQAQHPGISPLLRSMSSIELETGIETLALDMTLGYAERQSRPGAPPPASMLVQYTERYFLVRRKKRGTGPRTLTWAEASRHALCLLSPDMHNRAIVDRAFADAGVAPRVAIETNSTLALAVCVENGEVCSVMPGALMAALVGRSQLEAVPLVSPDVRVDIAFAVHPFNQPSRVLEAALRLARDEDWLRSIETYAGVAEG